MGGQAACLPPDGKGLTWTFAGFYGMIAVAAVAAAAFCLCVYLQEQYNPFGRPTGVPKTGLPRPVSLLWRVGHGRVGYGVLKGGSALRAPIHISITQKS